MNEESAAAEHAGPAAASTQGPMSVGPELQEESSMAQSNWSGEDPVRNAGRTADRAARQVQAKQQRHAAQTAGRAKRSI